MSSIIRVAAELDGATDTRHPGTPNRLHASATRLQDCLPALTLGIAVSGAAAALMAGFLEPLLLTSGQVRNLAAAYVLVTAALGWAVAYAASRCLRASEQSQAKLVAQLTAAAGVWWAPFAILGRDNSEWSLFVAVILFASITRLFDAVAVSDDMPASAIHDLITSPPVASNPVPIHVGAVLLVEASAVAVAAGHTVLASTLLGTATAVWVRRYDIARGEAFRRRVFSARVTRRISAASLLTVIALLPHLFVGHGAAGGNDWSVLRAFKVLLGYVPGHPGTAIAARPRIQGQDGDNTGVIPGPVFPGVVLYREARVTQLIAPPTSVESGTFGEGRAEPFVIPFRGVYWILRRPDVPPPKTSLVMRGNPAKRTFTSNDYQPLWMEAHDNLGTPIDVRCCSAVKLELSDNDARSNDVRVELVLENTRAKGRWMSLGTLPLATGTGESRPADRALTFALPRHTRIDEFNRLTVRFDLHGSHSYRSARIAIENFVLIPRSRYFQP